MRLLRRLLSIVLLRGSPTVRMVVLCCIGMIGAKADTAGILTWNGSPTVTAFNVSVRDYYAPYSPGYPGAVLDSNAITSSFFFEPYLSTTTIEATYTVQQLFTVTSAGDFLLSNSATGTGIGAICDPGGFCGGIGLDLSANGFGLQVGQDAAFVVPPPGTPGFTDAFLNANAFTSITVNPGASEIIQLADGTYTLTQNVDVTAYAADLPGMDVTFTTDLVPTIPEPRGYAVLLSLGFVLAILARKTRIVRQKT